MKKIILVVLTMCLLSFNFTSRASELVIGDWEGLVDIPESPKEVSTFVVEQADSGEYSITMYYAQERPFYFENLLVEEDGLFFDLDTGDKHSCHLKWDDEHSFAGECTFKHNDITQIIKISMQAPEVVVEVADTEDM